MNHSKLELLNLLDKQWKGARNYNPHVSDGILVEDDWNEASVKILFLMKETYTKANWWKISGQPIGPFVDDKIDTIWQNILRWRFLLSSFFSEGQIPDFPQMEMLLEGQANTTELSDIAYVNVSKEVGDSTSDAKRLQNRAIEDKEFLCKQIDIISPDVVLCAKTFWCYHPIYNGNETIHKICDNVYFHHGRIVIDFFHPGKPAGNKMKELYSGLASILQELEQHKPYCSANGQS